MKVVYTERFRDALDEAVKFGVDRFGAPVAERTFQRVIAHIEGFLAAYPRTGRWHEDIACFHTSIPRTPFVVFYRVAGDALEVLALFHHAQDNSTFEPD
jgi:plasmid stabilization system protein ParE